MYNGRISPRKTVKNKENMKFTPYRNRATVARPASKTRSAGGGSANVKVVVRVRPPNDREIGANSRTVVKVVENNTLTFDPKEDDNPFFFHGFQQRGRDMLKKTSKNIQFAFDRVFGYESDNSAVFEDSTKNLLLFLMDGYNCSVFVYGATGAGKTHTMLGDTSNPGITYLTMRELFRQIDMLKLERDFELGITYLEVYNETVKDLLNPGSPLHLREDGKFGVCVTGSKLHRIKNPDELFTLLRKGNANRTQHPTDANAESSRSHAVFQVYVDMATRSTGERRIAKLSMIDLAGSERGAATGCTGMRFTEGANINKSLLALGNCINSLADGHSHIPYRDSKLTRLLKDSLGGNCQTVMIANISPSSLNYEDTYNTLKYATRAKKIKSMLKKNLVNNELTIPQYVKLVENLNKDIENLRQLIKDAQPATVTCTCTSAEKEPELLVPEPKFIVPEPVIKSEPMEIIVQSPEKWREELKNVLQEKHMLQKQKQRLENSQELIKSRIKFKEISEATMSKLCLSNDQLEKGQHRIQASVSTYQRQSISVKSKLHHIQNQTINVDTKLQHFINNHHISTSEDLDFLKSNANANAVQYEIQVEQSRRLQEIYQTEMEHKDTLLNRMAVVLNYYYKLQNGYGHITDEMAEDYRSIIRMAQGIRSVKWQDQELDDPIPIQNQDSGISIQSPSPCDSKVSLISQQLQIIEEECLTAQRSAVKRKLYDLKSTEEDAASEDKRSKLTILDETVVLPEATVALPVPIVNINPDIINNSFFLNERHSAKKKKVVADRSTALASDNLLPRVGKTLTNPARKDRENTLIRDKPLDGTMARTQRFPLRNKPQVPQKALKPSKVLSSTRGRINNATTKR